MSISAEDRSRLLQGWLRELDPRLAAAFLDAARLRSFDKGAPLFAPGDQPGGMFGVIRGGVLLSAPASDGLLRPGHIGRAGQWFGTTPSLTGRPRMISAEALEPTVVAHVPVVAVDRLRAVEPDTVMFLVRLSDHGVHLTIRMVADLLIRDTDRRIGAVLLRVTGAGDGIAPEDPRGVPLTHALLAELSNASRESVGRAIAGFAARGWVAARYGRILVQDPAGLAAHVAGPVQDR